MKTIVATLCALPLAACAGPVNFARVDGQAINPAQLAQAKAICNGAAAASIRPTPAQIYAPSFNVVNSNIYGSSGSYMPSVDIEGQMNQLGNTIAAANDRRAAEMGCMAQLGYIEAPRN